MKVIEYVKRYGWDKLNEEFGITVKKYDCGLYVLNYSQIESPKQEDIVKECRGLIVDEDFNVVSRSFDRFFNLGECETTFDPEKSTIYEKVDGSLIKIYYWNNQWNISTRGTAFAESDVNGWGITFEGIVLRTLGKSMGDFQSDCDEYLSKDCTYIFEITSTENRVVTRYDNDALWYLACRQNQTGEYIRDEEEAVKLLGAKLPRQFSFSSTQECIDAAKSLPNLEEGYVVYENNQPVCKVKSPQYVAIHHLRGEGLNPKRIVQLVCMNEQDEYLKYYPEDREHFTPYEEALNYILQSGEEVYNKYKDKVEQKEFALCVKDHPLAACIFMARKKKESVSECFNSQPESYKLKVILKEVEG